MLFFVDAGRAFGYTVLMLDGSSGERQMTEKCCACEKEYVVCIHAVCGTDRGPYIVTHSKCDEYGCGECMEGCSGTPNEEYCEECANEVAKDARYDWATRRAEDGYRDA
jgi:hypothetical protein